VTVMVYQCDAEGQAWRLTRRQPDLVAADERPDDFDCISWMAALVDVYGVWSISSAIAQRLSHVQH
jgi:hypothetical protein